MFREQYKGAFDEIKADRGQIDKIFELAEKKPEKRAKIIPFHQVGTLVAAIAIVLVVSLYPDFSEFLKSEDNVIEPFGVVQPQVASTLDNTALTGAAPHDGSEEISEPVGNTVKKSAEENKNTEQKSIEPKETIKTENTEKSDAEEIITAKSESEQATHSDVNSEQKEVVVNDVAHAVVTAEKATGEVEGVSADEGVQDTATPVMASETTEHDAFKTKRASSGGSSAASPSLIFAEFPDFGEDKSAAVYAYRENEGITEKIEANAADMGGYKYVTVSDDAECRIAYAEKDGVLYQFTATNLTDTEFEELIGLYL